MLLELFTMSMCTVVLWYPWGISFRTLHEYQNLRMLKSLIQNSIVCTSSLYFKESLDYL